MSSTVQQLVTTHLSRSRIDVRLSQYPEINKQFRKAVLGVAQSPPLYCHPLGWRLGMWGVNSENVFQRFDHLLALAANLPNWNSERGFRTDRRYGSFWGLLWQLQVAEWLQLVGLSPTWNNPGPDLRVEAGGSSIWVECYAVLGAYEPVSFLEELLACVSSNLRVHFDPDADSAGLQSLEQLIEPCVARVMQELPDATARARHEPWPIPLYTSPQGGALRVDLHGDDMARYEPSCDRRPRTNRTTYYSRILRDACDAKSGKNSLSRCHPNVVMVNLAVSEKFQLANLDQRNVGDWRHEVRIPTDIDGLVWTVTGIDALFNPTKSQCIWNVPNHQIESLINGTSAA